VPDERTADAHVANLRRKLGAEGLIVTVRGAGYKLGGRGENPQGL
jgi:DNA-binding response OmpR family regulator